MRQQHREVENLPLNILQTMQNIDKLFRHDVYA